MRSSLFGLSLLALFAVSPLPSTAQAADDNPDLPSLQTKLREINPALAEEFEKRLNQSQVEIKQYKRGHIVFGRIQVEGNQDPRGAISQMIILQDGYFVDAIGAAGQPIGFRLNGFESAVVTPAGPGPIEDLGTIQLKRLPAERLCSVKGKLQIESHPAAPKPDEVNVHWDLPADPINTPSNGTEGISSHYRPVTSKVGADGTFTASEMSPGKYMLVVKAPNCVQYLQPVELKEGKTIELELVRPEMSRKMNVEFAVSKDGDFNTVEFKKVSLKADDRWRSSDDVPGYAFDLLIAQKGGNLLLDYRYAPCHIQDLGAAELDDELKVDIQKLHRNQPQSVPVEEGHVYVVFQASWKHWILLRTTDVSTIAAENKN